VPPQPTFDATAKTCSGVACHSIPSGTFTYLFPGGDGEPVAETVTYGGGTATPSWYSAGIGCTGCHGNPPQNYLWHGGLHGGGNQCELCHPDAVSVNGVATGLSTATNCAGPNGTLIACASLHANGTLDVQPKFKSTCFGCH
jgi:predicted CxxxxCH...CXXCH cytochrome family protein